MSTYLPADASGDPDPEDRASPAVAPARDGDHPSLNPLLSRILVVDDSAENVRLLLRILRRGGYTEVTGLTDPQLVLERVKDLVPDLVVVDLHMPQADGYAVMHQIRAALTRVPRFLLVTGDTGEDVRSLARARGADDLVTKPFQIEDLLRRVEALLGGGAPDSAGGRPGG